MAEQILKEEDGLTARAGQLEAASAHQSVELRRLIGGISEFRTNTESELDHVISLSRPSMKRPLAVLIAPIPCVDATWPLAHTAVALFVSDPDRLPRLPVDELMALYGLSPAEARLAVALIEEVSLKTAAERLAITEGTARVYLKRIFNKTDVKSQAALMKLLLTGPAALGS